MNRFARGLAVSVAALGITVGSVFGSNVFTGPVPKGEFAYEYEDAFRYLDTLTTIAVNTTSDRGEDKEILAQAAVVANIIYDHGGNKGRKALKKRGWTLMPGDDGSCCIYKGK